MEGVYIPQEPTKCHQTGALELLINWLRIRPTTHLDGVVHVHVLGPININIYIYTISWVLPWAGGFQPIPLPGRLFIDVPTPGRPHRLVQ